LLPVSGWRRPLEYDVPVHALAERVLGQIRRQELLHAGERVGVAVSGGIDSVALFALLLELRGHLGIVLSLVHFNHQLRGAESDADQEFVARLAREHDLESHFDSHDVARYAGEERISLEAAARQLRYGFFQSLLGNPARFPLLPPPENSGATAKLQAPAHHLDKIVTGHTLDDQAETVLMRLIRGAGLTGLAGIHPRIAVADNQGEVCGEIIRPLLAVRRRELEQYLRDMGQSWREDSTNADTSLTRNRVRKLLVPLLEREFNPSVSENLAELAEIARREEDYWDNEVAGWMGTTVHWSEPEWARAESGGNDLVQIGLTGAGATDSARNQSPASGQAGHRPAEDLESRIDHAPWLVANALVSRIWFLGEPIAVQRRLVISIGEHARIPLEFKHVEEILRFAAQPGKSAKELSLPRGWKVTRHEDELLFLTPDLRRPVVSEDYEYRLAVPGRTEIGEAGLAIETQSIPAPAVAEYNPDQLLDADCLPGPLRVRNWRAGDRFWPAHTKSPKKIKELLEERHVPRRERGQWPVVVTGDEIVWVGGFPTPAKRQPKSGRNAILIVASGGMLDLQC
jgi:tRNA(Ile)-lysidine synthase